MESHDAIRGLIRSKLKINPMGTPVPLQVMRFAKKYNMLDESIDLKLRIANLIENAVNLSQVYISRMYRDMIKYNLIPNQYKIQTFLFRHNVQTRTIDDETWDKIQTYINTSISDGYITETIIFIYLLSVYVLRINEMRQLTIEKLYQLMNGEVPHIRLKRGKLWQPIFSDELKNRSKIAFNYFEKRVEPNKPIFELSIGHYNKLFKDFYRKLFRKEPLKGFGPHTFRYEIAKRANTVGSLLLANKLLNHTRITTTKVYLKRQAHEFEKVYNKVFNDLYEKPN